MQIILRIAFALAVLITFAPVTYAGEAEAIQGDEGKSDPANKPGPGTSDAASPAAEGEAIKGDEGKSDPAMKPSAGSSDAANPAAEGEAIQGNEGK